MYLNDIAGNGQEAASTLSYPVGL